AMHHRTLRWLGSGGRIWWIESVLRAGVHASSTTAWWVAPAEPLTSTDRTRRSSAWTIVTPGSLDTPAPTGCSHSTVTVEPSCRGSATHTVAWPALARTRTLQG